MIVLDTTVLVYATGVAHPHRDPCRRLIGAIGEGRLEATTTVEVVQEYVHVRARRTERDEAAVLGRDFLQILSPLLAVTESHLDQGLALFENAEGLGAFDAVLAATVIATGASALVSADRAFQAIRELTHVIPDDVGVGSLLAD